MWDPSVNAVVDLCFQDSDLKQYLDNCGNLMSMHNVKVSCTPVMPLTS